MEITGTVKGSSSLIEGNSDDDLFPMVLPLYGITGAVTLSGYGGTDRYEIELYGTGSSLFNVYDEGTDLGADSLRIYGTAQTDFFLFRPGAITSIELDENREPVPNGAVERVNYDGNVNAGVFVFGREGDDTFVFDDTLSPSISYFLFRPNHDEVSEAFEQSMLAGEPIDYGALEDLHYIAELRLSDGWKTLMADLFVDRDLVELLFSGLMKYGL